MYNQDLVSKIGRRYSIQYNPYLDINIIMDCMEDDIETDDIVLYQFVNYIHGDPETLTEEDILYYINEYESNM